MSTNELFNNKYCRRSVVLMNYSDETSIKGFRFLLFNFMYNCIFGNTAPYTLQTVDLQLNLNLQYSVVFTY